MFSSSLLRCMALTLLTVILAACGNSLSMEKYNKLKVGQTYDEVRQVVGDPVRCDETLGVRNCVWGDEQRGISVSFVAGSVMLLSATNLK